METIVKLESISAGYGDEVILKDINLAVEEQDFIGVIGPNGGGKSTLVKVITGLIKPMAGKVIFHKGHDTPGNRCLIGYLPQFNQFDKKFPISVLDVVLSGIADGRKPFKRFSKNEIRQAIEIIDQMGISNLAGKNIGELSGGQMQRVFLCRAIISKPKLLILDEPNTYVDNKFEGDLYKTLKVLNKKMAIIMVSHDLGTITSYVKTIACVNRELHYHKSNIITKQQLAAYNCPIQIIAHGEVPHTILKTHNH
ncbi:MAG: zinc ABC transporter ATP-binding protein [Bacteroidetes bacterium 4484_276]|nr:MAG: zinc ABC transporter ATP-binding protein [Bacteroidetes bacterium 4484_276]